MIESFITTMNATLEVRLIGSFTVTTMIHESQSRLLTSPPLQSTEKNSCVHVSNYSDYSPATNLTLNSHPLVLSYSIG